MPAKIQNVNEFHNGVFSVLLKLAHMVSVTSAHPHWVILYNNDNIMTKFCHSPYGGVTCTYISTVSASRGTVKLNTIIPN